MRVLMTGGGTGGHVNPAIAIANKIKEREPDSEIAFVGTSHGIENKLVPQAGYPLHHIEIRGLKRSLSPENIKTAGMMVSAYRAGIRLVKEYQPDIVIGTGGYACWPAIRAAAHLGVVTVLHEANAIPGVAVRMLERYADRVYLNYEEGRRYLRHPEKAIRVGNPLRMNADTVSYADARAKLGITGQYDRYLLSLGGSMGAEQINFAMLDVMKEYTSRHPEILHVHATGKIEYEATKALFHEAGLDAFPNLRLLEYIDDMPYQMAAADLVVNRAGSLTLSEMELLGKACILIPSPNVTDNHQYKNAKVLADAGAAILMEEKDITKERTVQAVESVLWDDEKRHAMQDAIRTLAVSDAADRIYTECRQLIDEKNKLG